MPVGFTAILNDLLVGMSVCMVPYIRTSIISRVYCCLSPRVPETLDPLHQMSLCKDEGEICQLFSTLATIGSDIFILFKFCIIYFCFIEFYCFKPVWASVNSWIWMCVQKFENTQGLVSCISEKANVIFVLYPDMVVVM